MMNEDSAPSDGGLPIAAVERETGIPKDLLRMWERRYGFPQPARDAAGDRLYSAEQVGKLKQVRRLMDLGFRPGKLVGQSMAQLEALAQTHTPARVVPDVCAGLIDALSGHDALAVRELLRHRLFELGLRHFVCDFLAAANQLVGEAWMRGELRVHEEHLYSEEVKRVLRETLAGIPAGPQSPRVMLTTCPGELHLIGLLMVEALLRLAGCDAIAFGAQMPLSDIASAARKHRVDVVVLSFSAAYEASPQADVALLDSLLPDGVELWLGGSGCRGLKRLPPRATLLTLERLDACVSLWRERHPPAIAV